MPAGRPQAIIDWDLVDHLLEADCEGTEIAARIGVHPETLYDHCQEEKKTKFSDYLRLKKASGNTLLKEKQHNAALEGDRTMLVWLGKQRLGQREKADQNINIAARPLQVELVDKGEAEALGQALKGEV